MYINIRQSNHQYFYIYPSIHLSIYLSIYLSINPHTLSAICPYAQFIICFCSKLSNEFSGRNPARTAAAPDVSICVRPSTLLKHFHCLFSCLLNGICILCIIPVIV